jgi:hypothetical protein
MDWTISGLEHFTNEEDQGQVAHLKKRLNETLNKISGGE